MTTDAERAAPVTSPRDRATLELLPRGIREAVDAERRRNVAARLAVGLVLIAGIAAALSHAALDAAEERRDQLAVAADAARAADAAAKRLDARARALAALERANPPSVSNVPASAIAALLADAVPEGATVMRMGIQDDGDALRGELVGVAESVFAIEELIAGLAAPDIFDIELVHTDAPTEAGVPFAIVARVDSAPRAIVAAEPNAEGRMGEDADGR